MVPNERQKSFSYCIGPSAIYVSQSSYTKIFTETVMVEDLDA